MLHCGGGLQKTMSLRHLHGPAVAHAARRAHPSRSPTMLRRRSGHRRIARSPREDLGPPLHRLLLALLPRPRVARAANHGVVWVMPPAAIPVVRIAAALNQLNAVARQQQSGHHLVRGDIASPRRRAGERRVVRKALNVTELGPGRSMAETARRGEAEEAVAALGWITDHGGRVHYHRARGPGGFRSDRSLCAAKCRLAKHCRSFVLTSRGGTCRPAGKGADANARCRCTDACRIAALRGRFHNHGVDLRCTAPRSHGTASLSTPAVADAPRAGGV